MFCKKVLNLHYSSNNIDKIIILLVILIYFINIRKKLKTSFYIDINYFLTIIF